MDVLASFVENPSSRGGTSFSSAIAAGMTFVADYTLIVASGWFLFTCLVQGPGANVDQYFAACIISATVVVAMLGYLRLYDFDAISHPDEQIRRVIPGFITSFLLLALVAFTISASQSYSVSWGYLFFFTSTVLVCIERFVVYYIISACARRGLVTRNVVIVGGGEHGVRLIQSLVRKSPPWTRILGVFDDREDRIPETIEGYPVLGDTSQLPGFTRNVRVDDIFVALPWTAESRLLQIIDMIRVIPANVHLSPDIIGHVFIEKKFTQYEGIPVLNVFTKPLDGWNHAIKATEDKLVASILLLLTLPLQIALAVAVKMDSPGPVFVKHSRLSFEGKLIEVYKFRSLGQPEKTSETETVSADDPRVTRFGRFLIRSGLDKLPQFWNVLKGDLSVVGPRPHATQLKAGNKLYGEVVAEYAVRHKIKPGVTGWAQINGWRGEQDTDEKMRRRVECDLHYMESWSLFFDFYIILRTGLILLSGRAPN